MLWGRGCTVHCCYILIIYYSSFFISSCYCVWFLPSTTIASKNLYAFYLFSLYMLKTPFIHFITCFIFYTLYITWTKWDRVVWRTQFIPLFTFITIHWCIQQKILWHCRKQSFAKFFFTQKQTKWKEKKNKLRCFEKRMERHSIKIIVNHINTTFICIHACNICMTFSFTFGFCCNP